MDQTWIKKVKDNRSNRSINSFMEMVEGKKGSMRVEARCISTPVAAGPEYKPETPQIYITNLVDSKNGMRKFVLKIKGKRFILIERVPILVSFLNTFKITVYKPNK